MLPETWGIILIFRATSTLFHIHVAQHKPPLPKILGKNTTFFASARNSLAKGNQCWAEPARKPRQKIGFLGLVFGITKYRATIAQDISYPIKILRKRRQWRRESLYARTASAITFTVAEDYPNINNKILYAISG